MTDMLNATAQLHLCVKVFINFTESDGRIQPVCPAERRNSACRTVCLPTGLCRYCVGQVSDADCVRSIGV